MGAESADSVTARKIEIEERATILRGATSTKIHKCKVQTTSDEGIEGLFDSLRGGERTVANVYPFHF